MNGHLVEGLKVAVFLCLTIQLRIVHGPIDKAWNHVGGRCERLSRQGTVLYVQLKEWNGKDGESFREWPSNPQNGLLVQATDGPS